jgi:hypothetical protein
VAQYNIIWKYKNNYGGKKNILSAS